MNRLKVARSAVTISVLLSSLLGASGAGAKSTQDGKSQLAFGVDMAKRGLWSEARFRFEQARLLEPTSVSILNNLAICYEAGGRFEDALATYREAIRLAPGNKVVKQNYSRFADFYQGYRPRKTTETVTAPALVPAPPGTPGATEPPAAEEPVSEPAPEPTPEPPAAGSEVPPPPPQTTVSTRRFARAAGGGAQ